MRPIGTLPELEDAERFGDYLLAAGIANTVQQGPEGWIIWVRDEDQIEEAARELREFLADPGNPRYRQAARAADEIRRDTQRADRRQGENIIQLRQGWFRETKALSAGLVEGARKTRPLTLALIVISIAAALGTGLGASSNRLMNVLLIASVARRGAFVEWDGLNEILHGEVWRLVTPIFIHFGFIHILFNMWWLRDLGSMIEARKGALRLGFIVLVSAVVSNLAQYGWAGPLFGGMSGVVYALFGYIWMKGRFEPHEGLHLERSTVYWMIGWLFLCIAGLVGPIGNAAHVAGLLVGMLLGYLPYRLRRSR